MAMAILQFPLRSFAQRTFKIHALSNAGLAYSSAFLSDRDSNISYVFCGEKKPRCDSLQSWDYIDSEDEYLKKSVKLRTEIKMKRRLGKLKGRFLKIFEIIVLLLQIIIYN